MDCCLKEPTDELVELLIQTVIDHAALSSLKCMLADGAPAGIDVLELLALYPSAGLSGQELVSALAPMNPRLYSIASSMKQGGDQVHLKVGTVTFERSGRLRKGVASTLLAGRLNEGGRTGCSSEIARSHRLSLSGRIARI